jgi:hypothetical protein
VIKVIDSIARLKKSINGNPRYEITFTDGTIARTAADHQFATFIDNPGMRDGDTVRVEINGKGTISHMEPKS